MFGTTSILIVLPFLGLTFNLGLDVVGDCTTKSLVVCTRVCTQPSWTARRRFRRGSSLHLIHVIMSKVLVSPSVDCGHFGFRMTIPQIWPLLSPRCASHRSRPCGKTHEDQVPCSTSVVSLMQQCFVRRSFSSSTLVLLDEYFVAEFATFTRGPQLLFQNVHGHRFTTRQRVGDPQVTSPRSRRRLCTMNVGDSHSRSSRR